LIVAVDEVVPIDYESKKLIKSSLQHGSKASAIALKCCMFDQYLLNFSSIGLVISIM
jgi:hypothetical protein